MALSNPPKKNEILDLINTKLASNTSISADEHREIEIALTNAIYDGSVQLGDIKEIAISNLNDFETSGANIGRGKVGTIRYGWAICNGYNGTVDKRGRVSTGINISSAGGDSSKPLFAKDNGYLGGYESVRLTLSQIPPHTHNIDLPFDQTNQSNDMQTLYNTGRSDEGWLPVNPTPIKNAGGNSAGGTDAHDNCQPYIVGVFVQKITENY